MLLMFSALAARLVAKSSLSRLYDSVFSSYFADTLNGEGLQKPPILWINDGLMAISFFLIGLELKCEMRAGKLKNPRDVILPLAGYANGFAGQ